MTVSIRTLGLCMVAVAATLATPSQAHATAASRCVAPTDSTLLRLQASGQTFADFLSGAKARREGWLKMADSARVDDALLARARAVGGNWKMLVVAIDRCGDSMNSVPYLAKLAELVPGIDLRIVLPVNGRAVQESHKSLDGRSATPTIVLLDANGSDMGCIVELPREIRQWAHGVRASVSSDSLHAGIAAFYAKDRGKGITTEAVELLEAAKQGKPRCDKGS
jgi:hypothetical protein